MKYPLIILTALFVTACDSEAPSSAKAAEAKQETEDNPLLKMQNETVGKTEDAINKGLEAQQKQLDIIDQ